MSPSPLLVRLSPLVGNQLPDSLPELSAFIVGANPSKGARSPKLWNAAFAALGLDGSMFPLDVTADRLSSVLEALEAEPRVVGVAVAAPHKSEVARLCGERVAPAARRGGSVNVLSRGADGRFFGSNTDGSGALESLREVREDLERCRFLVLGCGGTGRAVVAALLDVTEASNVAVAVRGDSQHAWLRGLQVEPRSFGLDGCRLADFDVVINCTTIGWGEQVHSSPMSDTQIAELKADAIVFDVVYQPDPSRLLEIASARGLRTLSGSRMNLLQAVLAFNLCVPVSSKEFVSGAMSSSIDQP